MGNGRTVRINEIIGIFDMDTATVSEITKNYLRKSEREGCSELLKEELPKSFIVTDSGKNYYSQISPLSLCGRLDSADSEN